MKSIVKAKILNDQLVYRRVAGSYKQPLKFRIKNLILKLIGA